MTVKKSEPAKAAPGKPVKLTAEQAQELAARARAATVADALAQIQYASNAQQRRAEFERRERLAKRIERVIASRDRCGFWAHYTGRTREEHDTAVKLIRGGIDLDAEKIVRVLNDLPPEY